MHLPPIPRWSRERERRNVRASERASEEEEEEQEEEEEEEEEEEMSCPRAGWSEISLVSFILCARVVIVVAQDSGKCRKAVSVLSLDWPTYSICI
jgi:CO dehydrogenase/acetyl-CoA synthase beta subunit